MINFVAFGNYLYYNSLDRLKNEVLLFKINDINLFENIYLMKPNDLDYDFLKQHGEFINSNFRGYGYWIWKPYIILNKLKDMKEDDILLYCDAGCQLNYYGMEKMLNYFELLINSDKNLLVFDTGHIERKYTKKDLFIELSCTDDVYINTKQICTTHIFFKCNKDTIKFVEEWYKYCSNYNLVNDSPSVSKNYDDFIDHRHDQSIFSLLAKKYNNYICLDVSETYNTNWSSLIFNPILARRLK